MVDITTLVPLPRKYEPEVTAPAKVFIAPCAVVEAVPPAATGSVPAARAEALVEYSALLAEANVVRPVPPYPDVIVPPFHVPPVITVDPNARELVPQVTFSGMYACTSHVPPVVELSSNAIPAAPPGATVPIVALA
jgi:hypothetical protein